MRKRLASLIFALVMASSLALPSFAQDHIAPPSRDFSQYLTGEPLKKEELTLGGVPFYQISLDEAIPHLPTLDDTQTETNFSEVFEREMTEYVAFLSDASTNQTDRHWLYTIYAGQFTDSETLFYLSYNGGNLITGNVHRFETEVRDIATGDEMTGVLEKLGLSAEGAAAVAEEMTGNKTNFDLNSGKTFGSSYDYYHQPDNPDDAEDMPIVLYEVDDVYIQLYFLGGKLADVRMGLILEDDAPSFTDVEEGAYYEDAVKWAVTHEPAITNGATGTTFAPGRNCTEAEILTFLWRAAGEPAEGAKTPVANVRESDYFYQAAMWANDMGMIDPGTFDPAKPCTRSQAVKFIWAAFLTPEAPESGFTDVPAGADYAGAVSWAVANGITNGDGSDTIFSPDKVCTRAQIVTFLHRAYVPEARLTAN